MFHNCSNLQTVELINFDTSYVSSMAYMCYGCSSLKQLDLSFDTSRVVSMSHMFAGCKSLETLNISSFDTSRTTDMSGMFENCRKLTNLIHSLSFEYVNNMMVMFKDRTKLNKIVLNKIDHIAIVSNMFINCNVEVVVHPEDLEFMKENCESDTVKITCEN